MATTFPLPTDAIRRKIAAVSDSLRGPALRGYRYIARLVRLNFYQGRSALPSYLVWIRIRRFLMPKVNASLDTLESATPNGAVCYACGVLFPLVYLTCTRRARQNIVLRFHSFQCLLLFVLWTPFLIWTPHSVWLRHLFSTVLLLCFAALLTAMIQAWRGKQILIPIIGLLAERLAGIQTKAA